MAQQPNPLPAGKGGPAQQAQGGEASVSSAGAKVTVACKMPNGIRIRAYRMVETTEPIFGGGRRTLQVGEPCSDYVTIHGTSVPVGMPSRILNVEGYAITSGVPKDIWDSWLKDNAQSAIVKNKLVYADEDKDYVEDWAKEHGAETRSGLEPFMPDGDPRGPRANNPNLSKVEQEEEQRKRERGRMTQTVVA